jgi:hypothetical protein
MAFWQFRQLNPNETSGTSPAEDNFSQEERADFDILVRECIQNPIDARNADQPVEVRFSWKLISRNSQFLSDLITPEFTKQLNAASINIALPNDIPVLIIEDSGTTGLCGTFTDSNVEGNSENWNAFWFREGEGAKPTKANGGAGQGKLTMYLASKLRTVVAITNRSQDDKCLIFGSTRFRRNYTVASKRYARDARWCNTDNPALLAMPIQDSSLASKYENELGINRTDKYGTSFIIPIPADDINPTNVVKAVINEFYLPILRGNIKVYVQDTEISQQTITQIGDELGETLRISSSFRHFLDVIGMKGTTADVHLDFSDAWIKDSKILDEHIVSGGLAATRTAFENGDIVVGKFPIAVTPVNGIKQLGLFKVFLQLAEGDGPSTELYIRQDLSIDKERWLRSRLMPARALTLIDDDNLSRFLAAAEEPTHREWNGARPKLSLNYRNPSVTLRAVRHAANRFLELLAPPPSKDNVALSVFFPDFSNLAGSPQPKPKIDNKGKDEAPLPPKIPKGKARKIELIAEDDGALVRSVIDDEAHFTPVRCTIEFAYATEMGESFTQWDAADFYLAEKENLGEVKQIDELDIRENYVTFKLISPESSIRIKGFDKERQLEMRLKYSELENANDF